MIVARAYSDFRTHRLALAAVGLITLSCLGNEARAGSLSIGSSFPPGFNFTLNGNYINEPGGNIQPASLDGQPLPYVYCIAADVDINVPNTFVASVSTAGIYDGNLVNGAGAISWLMTNLAASAVTTDEQSGLQAAIWKQIYGPNFTLDAVNNDTALVSAYNADIAALGNNTAPLGNLLWITPFNDDGSVAQGLVAPRVFGVNSVPEPSTFALGSLGAIGAIGLVVRRRRRCGSRTGP
jgi:PEP-CTERM motif